MKEELEETWEERFKTYFDSNLHPPLQKKFLQFDTNQYPALVNENGKVLKRQRANEKPLMAKWSVINNLSKSFHSAFKRIFKVKSMERTEPVLITLYMYQAKRIQELDRAIAETGNFDLKPLLKPWVSQSGLFFSTLDFDTLLKNAKQAIVEYDPKTIESRDDNWMER